MKILPVVFASISLFGLATVPLHADVPKALQPTIDPKLEAVTADQLLRLIRELRGENGDIGMVDGIQEIDQVVMALAQLGRYEMALQYTYKNGQSFFDDAEFPPEFDGPMADGEVTPPPPPAAAQAVMKPQAAPSRLLASAETRSYIYRAAIYRKIVYGKRAEARALVPLIKKPEERLVPLMWLAAAALRDNQRAEALVDLNTALKTCGPSAARHEWLGLLMARAGQQATAKQIFAARRQRIEQFKKPVERYETDSDVNWGSLAAAMWSAGMQREALDILQAHPLAAANLQGVVVASKDSPQKRQALKQLAIIPNTSRFNDPLASVIPYSGAARPNAAEIVKQLEKVEYNVLKKISVKDKTEPDYYDWRLQTLAGVVAAWNYSGHPERAKAFLRRPSTHVNTSQRAMVEAIALLSVARFEATRDGIGEPWLSKVKMTRVQSQQLSAQLVGLLRQLRYDEIWNNHFSRVTGGALELLMVSGDTASGKALVKASEQALERNWRFSQRHDVPFASEFVLLAARFARVGDTASMKKWLARYQSRSRYRMKGGKLELYISAGLVQEAREFVETFSKPMSGPWTPELEAANADYENIMWRRVGYAEAEVVSRTNKTFFNRPSTPFALWCQRLPFDARVEALTAYSSSLSMREISPGIGIRDSGFWEIGE